MILLQLVTIALGVYLAKEEISKAYVAGVKAGIAASDKYVVDHDKVCPGWLFKTNLKEARVRICGKKGR